MLKHYPYDPQEIEAAAAPEGYKPIDSHSAYGCAAGPIFERAYVNDQGEKTWQRGFRVMQKHTNAGGAAHGGLLMTFADVLLATAIYKEIPPPFLTVRMTNDFLGRAAVGDWVVGEAKLVRRTGSLAFVEGILTVESQPIFTTSGIFRHKAGKA